MLKVIKTAGSSSRADVVDRLLGAGIVVEAWVKVAPVGGERPSGETRVVNASAETCLGYAEAIGRTAAAASAA